MTRHKNILLMMSGSIACAKATSLISEWVRRGHQVRVACTASAGQFVGRATLEGLSGHAVFDDTFEAGRAMDHIALAQWADLLVACPCSSNLINKFAHGIADDAVTTLWQGAWGRGIPQFIVPAMNTRMWHYPATRESVARLEQWGVHVLPTAEGDLACGEKGEGRMLEPADITRMIESVLEYQPKALGGKVLITGGGTREPIDAVRYIGNTSTGRTSAQLANAMHERGMAVTWLGARSAIHPQKGPDISEYETFDELQERLFAAVSGSHYDLVVQAAAVADFSPVGGEAAGKMSSGEALTLELAPNPKLINSIRSHSLNPAVRVIGFKLTAGASSKDARQAVARLFAGGGVDLVVHNDMREIDDGHHRFRLFSEAESPMLEGTLENVDELAARLLEWQVSHMMEETA